jgi:hypothetical protein
MMIRSSRMKLVGHLIGMTEMRIAYKISVRNQGKIALRRLVFRWRIILT